MVEGESVAPGAPAHLGEMTASLRLRIGSTGALQSHRPRHAGRVRGHCAASGYGASVHCSSGAGSAAVAALMPAGVEFVARDGGSPGLRLKANST